MKRHQEEGRHFLCDACIYCTYGQERLDHHMKIHEESPMSEKAADEEDIGVMPEKKKKNRRFLCEYCPYKSAYTMPQLDRHIQRRHLGIRYVLLNVCYSCDTLKKYFRTDYNCPDCEHLAPNAVSLRMHGEKKHSVDEKLCHACDFRTPSGILLKKHVDYHHAQVRRVRQYDKKFLKTQIWLSFCSQNVKCSLCDHVAKNSKRLAYHKRSVHDGKAGRNECRFCNYRGSKQSVFSHERSVHSDSPPAYMCSKCPYATNELFRLERHEYTKHGDK